MDLSLTREYAETMDKLLSPDDWDIPGLIADIAENLRTGNDNGESLAVIDTLCFQMADIARLISPDYARKITPETIAKAAEISSRFTRRTLDARSN